MFPYLALVCAQPRRRGAAQKAERRTVIDARFTATAENKGFILTCWGFYCTPHASPFGRDSQSNPSSFCLFPCCSWHFFVFSSSILTCVSNDLRVRSKLSLS